MKIIDASVEDFVEGLTQGQIIRRNGIFLMVTDLTDGENEIELASLETGEVASFNEESLVGAINNPNTSTMLVTKSELKILKYFK